MQGRLVVFFILSFAIIAAYPFILEKMGVQVMAPPADSTPSTNRPAAPLTPADTQIDEQAGLERHSLPPLKLPAAVSEREYIVESDLYRVVLSNIGGTIKTWELKKVTDNEGKRIHLIPKGGQTAPLSLVHTDSKIKREAPVYQMASGTLRLNEERPEGAVEMAYIGPHGETVRKRLRFRHDQYAAHLTVYVQGNDAPYNLSLGSNFGILEWNYAFGGQVGAISRVNDEIINDYVSDIEQTEVREGQVTWVALQDKYFISALIPALASTPSEKGIKKIHLYKEGDRAVRADVSLPQGSSSFTLYAGPKEYDRLSAFKNYLEETIDFGWFLWDSWLPVRLIAKPLFYVLRFLHGLTNNYGWAIILLTVLIKIVFYPATRASMVSMKALAALQPKVAEIRERLAHNKEKMNAELMNLYKASSANPLGGCLPMLLQMPVFIALFNILYTTVDLRQAPFILWIYDLSSKDPYYVLPVIMGISMILQQWMTPSTMDPTQAKIMLVLPVVYTFFFISFPSGLVLYWLVNNILGIAQQYWINRQIAVSPQVA